MIMWQYICNICDQSLMVHEKIRDACKALFEVPAKREGQKPILSGRVESEPIACKSSGGNSESPQFFHYGQKQRHIWKEWGYDFTKWSGLNFSKEKRTYFVRLYRKAKTLIANTRPEGDSIMYLCQSHQILNLKQWLIMTARQQHRRGIQTSASTISLEVSKWTWYQPATLEMTKEILLNLKN